jgi:hypothetical protein
MNTQKHYHWIRGIRITFLMEIHIQLPGIMQSPKAVRAVVVPPSASSTLGGCFTGYAPPPTGTIGFHEVDSPCTNILHEETRESLSHWCGEPSTEKRKKLAQLRRP